MAEFNTGVSVKERMKLFMNQKTPADASKEKQVIIPGVSVKDRLVGIQQTSKVNESERKIDQGASPASVYANKVAVVENSSKLPASLTNAADAARPLPAVKEQPDELIPIVPKKEIKEEEKQPVVTGVSVKDRMSSFSQKPEVIKPKSTEVTKLHSGLKEQSGGIISASPNEDIKEAEKQPFVTGVSVKDRMSAFFQKPITTESDKKLTKETLPNPSVPDRSSNFINPAPLAQKVEKPELEKSKFEPKEPPVLVTVKEEYKSEKPVNISGVSVKERLAALQQSSKVGQPERKIPQEIIPGSSVAERINQLKDASKPQVLPMKLQEFPKYQPFSAGISEVQSATVEKSEEPTVLPPGRMSDVKALALKFQESNKEELSVEKKNATVDQRPRQSEEFKKRIEGMVFVNPFIMNEEPVRIAKREPEPVVDEITSNVLVHAELVKPIRKRTAVKFNADFD